MERILLLVLKKRVDAGVNAISELAKSYRKAFTPSARFTVLRRAWSMYGHEGVKAVALATGLNPEHVLRSFQEWLKARRRAERGKMSVIVIPPPAPLDDIGEVAKLAAGGGIETYCGGKRTNWKDGSGHIKSAAGGQAWDALMGGSK
ncbi:hypothetical protein [Desulfotomaculum copahuensis]|uniref:Uncharacterized protein n=1 Tax=Desulfotomaculum copahuensis TaxID=1838280 RepID=A0A1B7LGE1_9FIRM|nr:hypothetical protein [Desulfotomaculum copahuensis]OAT83718.1 hypothetical protein A6M21_07730 [Desulfotomaculum copahuensis]